MSNSSTASKIDSLLGLGSAKRIVRSLSRPESACHAILFYGADGSGKEELAAILAQVWLCNHPGPEGADGDCRACASFERGTNPDLLRIAPMGAGNLITMKQMEEVQPADDSIMPMQRFLRTQPLLSGHKVVVISQAERMNDAFSNSLLKTLEEPPPFAKIILTSTSVGAVRSTILSRTLAVACSLPTNDDLKGFYPGCMDDDLLLAEGTPGKLKRVLDHANEYRALYAFARDLRAWGPYEGLIASEAFRELSARLEKRLRWGARLTHAECLQVLATVFARESGFPAGWSARAIDAHDRILANGQASLIFDMLFTGLLSR